MSEEMNKNLHKSLDDLLAKNRDLAKTKGDLEKTIDDELHKLKTQEAANAKKRNEDQQTSREPTKIQKSSTSRGGRTRSQRRSWRQNQSNRSDRSDSDHGYQSEYESYDDAEYHEDDKW